MCLYYPALDRYDWISARFMTDRACDCVSIVLSLTFNQKHMDETIIKICEEETEKMDRVLPTSSLGQWIAYSAFYRTVLPNLATRLTDYVNTAIDKDPQRGHVIKKDAIEALRSFRERFEPAF